MPSIQRFEEIRAWQTARDLTRHVYSLSNQGPFSRDYGFRDQIRRATVSIMSNIAEGFESATQSLFIQFLGYARASAAEVRAQLYVAKDVHCITETQFTSLYELADKCSRQLSRFIAYLRSHPSAGVYEPKVTYEIDRDV